MNYIFFLLEEAFMEWDYNTNFYGNKRTCFLINLQLILNIYLYCFLYRNMYVIIDIITFYLFQLFPKWIAPNLLTLTGFLQLVANFFLLTYYDCSFYAASRDHPESPPIPNWVWLLCGLNMFISHTLGNYFSHLLAHLAKSNVSFCRHLASVVR